MHEHLTGYWLSRFLFERGLALTYLIAFAVIVNQFLPLLGERGLLPVPLFARTTSFGESPSIFLFLPNNRAFLAAGWTGIILSLVAFSGIADQYFWSSAILWAALWVIYLSFVNVGQTFYGFGWETLLLEAGFFTIFAGSVRVAPEPAVIWIWRWILFRVMFGAGLIKVRADPCWRNLSCLDYFFETQPIPNPLSWYFHWLPRRVLKGGVAFNHFVELAVPFGYFCPQPVATIAGVLTIVFQVILMLGGNLSWLNFITIVLAISTLDDGFLSHFFGFRPPALHPVSHAQDIVTIVLAGLVVWLSVKPVRNMLSRRQLMNYSYNRWHLVNTYGAFGGITRLRYEIVLEGSSSEEINRRTEWREYQFRGKPVNPAERPRQIAPYHLRLDWLMWFAAMQPNNVPLWLKRFVVKLLEGDKGAAGLLRSNPFPETPPRYVRGLLYEYRFTTPAERRETGLWWNRTLVGTYLAPVKLPAREAAGWLAGARREAT